MNRKSVGRKFGAAGWYFIGPRRDLRIHGDVDVGRLGTAEIPSSLAVKVTIIQLVRYRLRLLDQPETTVGYLAAMANDKRVRRRPGSRQRGSTLTKVAFPMTPELPGSSTVPVARVTPNDLPRFVAAVSVDASPLRPKRRTVFLSGGLEWR